MDSLTLEKDTIKKQRSIISRQILLNGWWLPNIKKNVFAPNWACWSKRTLDFKESVIKGAKIINFGKASIDEELLVV